MSALAPLSVLIVDDEPLARRGIRARLERSGRAEVVGECATGREAIAAIRDLAPEVVFLDVQMPGIDGFGVVEAVGPRAMPVVVFVTAYDEHALRAFEAEALDYLLKPIDGDRLRRALERAEARVRGQNRAPEPVRFVVRSAGRVRFVDAADVVYVEAARDYVVLHTASGSHLLRSTMDAVERDLHGEGFLRIHRSTLVRASRVCEVRPTGSGGVVTMRGGARFRVSRGRWNDTLAALKATGQRIG